MEERRQCQQQSIEVIIRIKPRTQDNPDEDRRKCVFMSPTEENTIVVETQNKKQFFSFDHIASEESQQQEIYDSIGQPVLEESFKGFNCCIFAYGQTGAGKTYSILGNPADIAEDSYCESRGLLPRLLEQLFLLSRRGQYSSCQVKCSYLEIYNEQIIDLLNKDIKTYQIRQDHKKGVYVEGLLEEPVNSYEKSLEIIMKGLKNRKIAATSMNSQSSRSHTIFSISLTVNLQENGLQKSRYSKIHIVDLAGSQRTKLAKVDGQRLREGCNINKSLHALGNVINSLVQSSKKKKYIPFRDSKLTFFLKDSLGGNSKTKLLANINPCRAYLGDTLSTLMFAKRAKIIKVRVQANQNIADNFQSLRNQIRKLRQELAQTKFIKNQPKAPELDQTVTFRLADFSVHDLDQGQQKVLKIFEDNQLHYRNIIAMYQKRIENMSTGKEAGFKVLFTEKKSLQRSCGSYAALLAGVPAFTRIFKDNLQLKKKLKAEEAAHQQVKCKYSECTIQLEGLKNINRFLKVDIQQVMSQNESLRGQIDELTTTIQNMKSMSQRSNRKQHGRQNTLQVPLQVPTLAEELSEIPSLRLDFSPQNRSRLFVQKGALTRRDQMKDMVNRQNEMLQAYQRMVEELKENMAIQMNELTECYAELQKELQMERQYKHSLKKQQGRRKQLPANMETLQNQNQYLKLNVMELQTEVAKLQEEDFKKQIQLRSIGEQNQKLKGELAKLHQVNEQQAMRQEQLLELIDKIQQLKDSAERQQREFEQQRQRLYQQYQAVKSTLVTKVKQNLQLSTLNEVLTVNVSNLKKRLAEVLKVESQQSVIIAKESACWTTLQQENLAEQFILQKTMNQEQFDSK